MRIRISTIIIALIFLLIMLAGCGGSFTNSNTNDAASLVVNSARVSLEPHLTRLPINQEKEFTITLAAAGTTNQPLQVSLRGSDDSYPLQTRNQSLQNAFPDCSDTAILTLSADNVVFNPSQQPVRSLADTQDSWTVYITPQSTGPLDLDGEIDVTWTCPNGETFGAYKLASFSQSITVFDPHPYNTFLGDLLNNGWVIAVGSSLLTAFIIWIITRAIKRRASTKVAQEPAMDALVQVVPIHDPFTQHRSKRKIPAQKPPIHDPPV